MTMRIALLIAGFPAVTVLAADAPSAGTHGHYRLLPAEPRSEPPFNVVDFTYGPVETVDGEARHWWQLEVRIEDAPDAPVQFQLRAATSRDPLAVSDDPLVFRRYQLHIPDPGDRLEYRNVHTSGPLLPAWQDFVRYFIPSPAKATGYTDGMPHTCEYLGHVLTLRAVDHPGEWKPWDDVKTLDLDPELLIGTSRNFKDRDGVRLPQKPERQNYPYLPFTADDYRKMIETGINLYTISPDQQQYVRTEPVFYRRSAGGDPALLYPADLYRSNYVGTHMFMDEPTIIMVGDKNIHTVLKYFTDAAAVITKRVRSRYLAAGSYGAYNLESQFRSRGVSFGDMRLGEIDYPSWETLYETAFYQLAGGIPGIVHEGRYQLGEFNEYAHASTGFDRKYTAEEMFHYYFAFLRGAARHFDGDWGTSIYGQADPALSPLGVKLAYDMGARYLWYWTSDHDHHLPWPEQLELTRIIREHAAAHPRPSIRGPKPVIDKAIVIPYGYLLTLESPTSRKQPGDLWWVRELDAAGQNESSQRYRRLMRNAFREINAAFDAGQDFDITVDDGRPITGYRNVVHINDREETGS